MLFAIEKTSLCYLYERTAHNNAEPLTAHNPHREMIRIFTLVFLIVWFTVSAAGAYAAFVVLVAQSFVFWEKGYWVEGDAVSVLAIIERKELFISPDIAGGLRQEIFNSLPLTKWAEFNQMYLYLADVHIAVLCMVWFLAGLSMLLVLARLLPDS